MSISALDRLYGIQSNFRGNGVQDILNYGLYICFYYKYNAPTPRESNLGTGNHDNSMCARGIPTTY